MNEKRDVQIESPAPSLDPVLQLIRDIKRHVSGIIGSVERYYIARKKQTDPSTPQRSQN
jgi:hypothetical protein